MPVEDDPKRDLDLRITISYKTLVVLSAIFAAVTRVVDALLGFIAH